MARLTSFQYRHGTTPLHRHDPRCKLLELGGLCIVCAGAGPAAAGLVVVLATAALAGVGVSPVRLLRDLRWLGLFLALLFLVRAASTPGEALFARWGVVLTREGLEAGGLLCCRLAGIVLLSLLFVRTTPPPGLKAAVQWLLSPVPFVPERRVAVMMGLMLRFIPLLFQQAADLRESLAARGMEGCRNPLRRLRFTAVPLLRRTLLSADRLALAMTARCYSERRTDPGLTARPADGAGLCGAVLLGAVLLFLS